MWRTPEGDMLSLPIERADALRGRLARLGLVPIVRAHHRGDLGLALQRTAGTLVQRARRAGNACSPVSRRCYRVYRAQLGGRSYRLLTRPDASGVQRIALIEARSPAEREDGDGTRMANLDVLRQIYGIPEDLPYSEVMRRLAIVAAGTRRGRAAVTASGSTDNSRRPDRAYIDQLGRRVNIEVDTRARVGDEYMKKLMKLDPDGVHYSLRIGPAGNVIGAVIKEPGKPRREVRTPAAIKRIMANLPVAHDAPNAASRARDRERARRVREAAGPPPPHLPARAATRQRTAARAVQRRTTPRAKREFEGFF